MGKKLQLNKILSIHMGITVHNYIMLTSLTIILAFEKIQLALFYDETYTLYGSC